MKTSGENKHLITKIHKADLKKELDRLKNTERKKVISQIQAARSQGDLSENSEYHSARESQAILEGRINEIEYILENSEIVATGKELGNQIVLIGSMVDIKNNKGDVFKYTIVDTSEIDLTENKISKDSPLGMKLFEKKVGDQVDIDMGGKKVTYKIIKIY